MIRIAYRVIVLALATTLAISAANSALSQQSVPPLTLSGSDPVTVTVGEDATVDVFNNTAGPLKAVTAQLVDTVQTDGKSLSGVAEIVGQTEFTLDPDKVHTITIRAKEGAPGEGKEYAGYLVVYHAGANAARRKVQLVSKKKAAVGVAQPQPLVKTWNVKVYRGDFWRRGADAYLPVVAAEEGQQGQPAQPATQPKAGEGQQQQPAVFGYLTGSLGNVAEVGTTGVRSRLTKEADKLELTFRGIEGPGTFTGKIDPLQTGADEKDDVQMNVTVAHHFIYAMLALVAGILLALWFQQRYVGVLRPVWELRQGEARLGRLFGSARAKFNRAAEGESYADYTIEADVARGRRELVGQLDALPAAAGGKLDETNPAYKRIVEEMKRLEAVIAEWGSFAAKLRALRETAERARAALAASTRPDFIPDAVPRIIARAANLLRGVALTVPAFEARVAEVAAASVAVGALPALNQGVVDLYKLIEMIDTEALDDNNAIEFAAAKKNLNSVWYDLWRAEDFKADEACKRLFEIHKSISLIIASQGTLPDEAGERARSLVRSFDLVWAGDAPADDRERESFFRGRVRKFDLAFVALSLFVAVNTGLTQLYYDKPFGTPRDYLNALLWGFATQTALAALTAGMQRLWNWGTALSRA